MTAVGCRNCSARLETTFVDLGLSPLANEYLPVDEAGKMQRFFPLKVYVCDRCLLVQLDEIESHEAIFSNYAYLSSASASWLAHARTYAGNMQRRLDLGRQSRVVELASNDGYLLQYFAEAGIPVLGVEPAANVAQIAIDKGIPTVTAFFGAKLAEQLREDGAANLVIANNVLAHVPDIHDFVEGVRNLLQDDGVFTAEFPHLLNLIRRVEFDTIYHEHFSYFSLRVMKDILARHHLELFDVDELPTHGGSLRIYAQHAGGQADVTDRVASVLREEQGAGLNSTDVYAQFAGSVREAKRQTLRRLISYREAGQSVVGFGAPAKAATLFNYCGIDSDLVDFTVDSNPLKQGCFIPGTRVAIHPPARLSTSRADLVWVLPWNLKDEIIASIRDLTKQRTKVLLWDDGLKEVA